MSSASDQTRLSAVVAASVAAANRLGCSDRLLECLRVWSANADPVHVKLVEASVADAELVVGPPDVVDLRSIVDAAEPIETRAAGAFYTPRPLAELIVDRAFLAWSHEAADEHPRILDPCCGSGAVLLSAADATQRRGLDPARVVVDMAGADIDPIAVLSARLVLGLWGVAASGEWASPDIRCIDVLHGDGPAEWASSFELVVGNPPFQGQLLRRTARTASERRGARSSGYADAATVALDRSLDWASAEGAVALLQPRSVLAARDARALRRRVAEQRHLRELWLDDEPMFGASVRVCLPVVAPRASPDGDTVVIEGLATEVVGRPPAPSDDDWVEVTSTAARLPSLGVVRSGALSGATLADIATVQSDFREWFYAVAEVVRESVATAGAPASGELAVLTSGSIDPLENRWGIFPSTILRRRFLRPVVDEGWLAARSDATLRRAPKVIVANQTRLVEAVPDANGRAVGLTPTISVIPHEPSDVGRVAALLSSPQASVHVARGSVGLGLSVDAMRVTAASLRLLPLPVDADAWSDAARLISGGAGVEMVGRAMWASGGSGHRRSADADELLAWWLRRLHRTAR